MLSTFKTNFQDKFANLSFKTKALATVVLLSILPVLGVGTLAYVISRNTLFETETTNQQFAATTLSDALLQFVSLRSKDAQTMADLPFANNAKITAITPRAVKEAFLNDYITRTKIFDGAVMIDLQGNPIAASVKDLNFNYADQDYFKQVIKTGKPYVTKIEISKVTKLPSILFAAPIKDDTTNQLIGVLRLRMPASGLKSIAASYGNKDTEWHIIDKNSDKFVVTADASDTGHDVKPDFPSYDRLKTNSNAISTFEIDNGHNKTRERLISIANVAGGEDTGALKLSVLMATDADVINAKENGVLLALALGMLVAGATTGGLALLFGNRVTKFIGNLADSIVTSSVAIVDTVEMQEVTVNMQANSAIETSTTVNELGAISVRSAEQAESAANGAKQALSLSEDGTRSVQQTLQGMSGLRDKVDAIANQIVSLSEQTGQITVVSDLVADLASQTNMLALNAAVEAARAGEQGKGFSVVADEIRKLADQSKKSADKINVLANDIQAAINRTVMVTDEGTKTVNEGIDLARSTADTFVGVTDAVNNVYLNSQQISTSAKQQAVSIQQVLSSMTTISQGSQESAVGMHQVKMTTRELTQVADELKAAVV